MVEVNLWANLRPLVDGQKSVEVEATNVGELLRVLVEMHPRLKPAFDAGVSVAIDGRLIANSLTEPIQPNSEVFLMQRLRGG